MPGRINECPFLRRQCRCMRSVDVGKQAEDMERAEGERDHDMISFRRMPEECSRGVEEIGEGMFIMQQGQEKFHAALCAEKSRQVSRRDAAGHGNGGSDEPRRAGRFFYAHDRAPEGQEGGPHAAARTAGAAGARRKSAAFPREENAETIRLPHVNSPENKRVVVRGMGHAGRGGRRRQKERSLRRPRQGANGKTPGAVWAEGELRRREREG